MLPGAFDRIRRGFRKIGTEIMREVVDGSRSEHAPANRARISTARPVVPIRRSSNAGHSCASPRTWPDRRPRWGPTSFRRPAAVRTASQMPTTRYSIRGPSRRRRNARRFEGFAIAACVVVPVMLMWASAFPGSELPPERGRKAFRSGGKCRTRRRRRSNSDLSPTSKPPIRPAGGSACNGFKRRD